MLYLTVFYLSAGEKLPPNSYYEGLAVDILKNILASEITGDHFRFSSRKKKKRKKILILIYTV